jgi:DNA polymerase I-like protein with 3'-5' exonuclease and polymerase domains
LDTDVYEFLGKAYFHKEKLTPEEIKLSKNQTFQNFYGGIKEEYLNIDFFKKTHEYITHRWKFFEKNGYVETPVFKRRITEHHISDPNPNKLFNYLLQAAETEFSIQNISRINDFLRNKESKVVLYTYDSILVDLSKNDGMETVHHIKNTMIDNQFPVKCYVGKNYNDLCEIEIKP